MKLLNTKYQIPKTVKKLLLVCVLVILVTNFATYRVAYDKGVEEDKTVNPYPLIDFSRNFIPQEDFIVNLQPLRESLTARLDREGKDRVSMFVEFLNTGSFIQYNPDARFHPASLVKMPAAIATVKKIEQSEWAWDSELVLLKEDVDEAFGNLYREPLGSSFSIERLLEEAILNSDNTAYRILIRNVGLGEVEQFLEEVGLEELYDKNLNITVREYTRIFRSLYSSSYLKREYSQKVLEILAKDKGRYLGRGFPDNVLFAHKFGENLDEHIYADSGIVYLPHRPYIITMIYRGDGEESRNEVNAVFEDISREVYEYFLNYAKN